MSIGICRENSQLSATIFDLPQVTRAANKFIKESKLNQRIQVQAGNFKEDELPINFDVALLANLLSVASEEINRQLFKQIYEKLPVGGAIILSGWILDDARTSL
jgi:ribosomal protein L11 methylase PrmA